MKADMHSLPANLCIAYYDLIRAQNRRSDAMHIAAMAAEHGGYGLKYATGWDDGLEAKILARKRKLALAAFTYAARALALLGLACPKIITLQNNEAGPSSGVTQSRPFPARAVKGLVSGASQHHLSLATLSVLNRWWIGELLNALLRPMFCRMRAAKRAGLVLLEERFEWKFLSLLNACPCFPFLVIADDCGLWILEGEAADEARDRMEEEDSFAAERDACPALSA